MKIIKKYKIDILLIILTLIIIFLIIPKTSINAQETEFAKKSGISNLITTELYQAKIIWVSRNYLNNNSPLLGCEVFEMQGMIYYFMPISIKNGNNKTITPYVLMLIHSNYNENSSNKEINFAIGNASGQGSAYYENYYAENMNGNPALNVKWSKDSSGKLLLEYIELTNNIEFRDYSSNETYILSKGTTFIIKYPN